MMKKTTIVALGAGALLAMPVLSSVVERPAMHGRHSSPTNLFTPITGNASYKLVFDDEFNGASLDTTVNWSAPGNHVDHTYSGYSPSLTINDLAANTTVHNGCLDMAAAFVGANNYSTSGIVTKGSVTGPGVYWEERVKMPTTFNGESFDGGWTDQSPGFGPTEIDTNEFWTPNGKNSNGWNPGSGFGAYIGTTVSSPSNWHIFSSWWTSTAVTYYLDGVQTQQVTNGTNQATPMWYSIVTNAICSHNVCGGQADGTSRGFPAHMFIDYIHVYALTGTAITPQTNYGGPGDNSGASTTCSGN